MGQPRTVEFNFRGSGHGSVITIDGEPVKGLRSATIHTAVNEPTRVTLELVGVKALGDVPPAEDILIEVTDCDSVSREYERYAPAP